MATDVTPDEEEPIFAIAVAAELAGMHPQTLRQYDRLGLVTPGRTQGGSRRYSLRHVKQLREVAALSAEGMSLPAISRLVELSVPGLMAEPDVFVAVPASTYRWPDPDSGQQRYQTTVEMTVCE